MDAQIAPGQFDDAPEHELSSVPVQPSAPESHARIDDELLQWSEDEEREEEEEDFEPDEDDYEDQRVEDEDWEIAERDFTKQYNRLRQRVAVRTGQTKPSQTPSTSTSASTTVPLPALNRIKQSNPSLNPTTQRDKTADQLHSLSKFSSRLADINQPWVGVNRKGPSAIANMKDKSDRATNEQVLDDRTRLILFKMIGRGLVKEVNGCVSSGKEANVYHALSGTPATESPPLPPHLALKIYKTSILIFKDRDRYVSGEHRFRRGYSRHNPRKMVRLWAEKEMRNLKRLRNADIRCPEPVEVRENVLAMEFLGDGEGWASPRLKDADIVAEQYSTLYKELLLTVRTMFQTCKLVHADLSEYNIIYHNSHLYIIDVGQSVEHDHPHAFDFLRSDMNNVEEHFGRNGVKVLGVRKAFEFVTKEDLGGQPEGVLAKWFDEAVEGNDDEEHAGEAGQDKAAAHEDAVFMQSWIPRTLTEVKDPERDLDILNRGEGDKLIYADTIGLVQPALKKTQDEPTTKKGAGVRFADEDSGGTTSEGESDADDDEYTNGDADKENGKTIQERAPKGHRHEDKEAKKVSFPFPCLATSAATEWNITSPTYHLISTLLLLAAHPLRRTS
ncbi:RIO1-domain-containing protein [Neolentinus lepideus HHB14362 ss-1]|uniref:Serine/threonine-protein kinase RIO1 n=1 Tax=Neolentinus lepideus HHB14362 ss-1 TaxID=1314782 RepID=A0A165R8B8_9AGAM|nr:RIO1-domain-containing protein [Neolentinus lepideus HHB14362 ss-1]